MPIRKSALRVMPIGKSALRETKIQLVFQRAAASFSGLL
jgi:hypothetical protein